MVFNLIDRQCAFTVMESTLYKCPPTVDVDGGVRKKYGFKGGVRRKILGLKWGGGVAKKKLSSFAVMASVIMETVYQTVK